MDNAHRHCGLRIQKHIIISDTLVTGMRVGGAAVFVFELAGFVFVFVFSGFAQSGKG